LYFPNYDVPVISKYQWLTAAEG